MSEFWLFACRHFMTPARAQKLVIKLKFPFNYLKFPFLPLSKLIFCGLPWCPFCNHLLHAMYFERSINLCRFTLCGPGRGSLNLRSSVSFVAWYFAVAFIFSELQERKLFTENQYFPSYINNIINVFYILSIVNTLCKQTNCCCSIQAPLCFTVLFLRKME